MAGFYFRPELEDGTPADPPTLHTAVPIGRLVTTGPKKVRSGGQVPAAPCHSLRGEGLRRRDAG